MLLPCRSCLYFIPACSSPRVISFIDMQASRTLHSLSVSCCIRGDQWTAGWCRSSLLLGTYCLHVDRLDQQRSRHRTARRSSPVPEQHCADTSVRCREETASERRGLAEFWHVRQLVFLTRVNTLEKSNIRGEKVFSSGFPWDESKRRVERFVLAIVDAVMVESLWEREIVTC